MKRLLGSLLAIMMLFAAVGCAVPLPSPASDPTEAPTEAVPAETTEAAEAPTEAPAEPEAPLPEDPNDYGDCVKDAEVLLYLPYGEQEDQIGLLGPDEDRDWYNGPTSFAVSGGKIYIVDSIKERALIWDGEALSSFPLPIAGKAGECSLIAVAGDIIYGGYNGEEPAAISAFDMAGNKLSDLTLPEEMAEAGISRLFETDGKLCVYDYNSTCWELENGEFVKAYEIGVDQPGHSRFTAAVGELAFNIDSGENSIAGIERIIGDRAYCRGYEFAEAAEKTDVGTSYRVYDPEGRLIGATAVKASETLTLDGSEMYVSQDGTVYIMACLKDGVYITRPNLRAAELWSTDND